MTGPQHTRMVTDAALSPVLLALRGERQDRPAIDLAAAAPLRVRLEAATRGRPPASGPIAVSPRSLRTRATADVPAPVALRGTLVAQALRLLCVGARPPSTASLLAAWRADAGTGALARAFDQLTDDERARLESDVAGHVATVRRELGPVPAAWSPRTAVRAHQRLGGGMVIVRDLVDLMVGTMSGEHAAVSLLDVTTGPLDVDAERVARYHALVQTLRTATVPLRTAVLSSATGELWCYAVNAPLLERAVEDLEAVLVAPRVGLAA